MKRFKKLIALLLAMIIATCFATTAMASECDSDSQIPENAICNTIELTVFPGETIEKIGGGGVAPLIWNQENHVVNYNKTYTQQFIVPERYFAYEMRATNTSGNAISGSYSVALYLSGPFTSIASATHNVNGNTYKVDNIDLGASNQSCLFCITNFTGVPISVTITYYSWT